MYASDAVADLGSCASDAVTDFGSCAGNEAGVSGARGCQPEAAEGVSK